MYPIKKTLLRLGVLLLVLSMSACVSQRQGRQVDRAAALDTYIQLAMAYIESGNREADRKSTRLNSSYVAISYAVFCLKKKTYKIRPLAFRSTGFQTGHPVDTLTI